jgi:predicted tellurium resistance membrane protein TerC
MEHHAVTLRSRSASSRLPQLPPFGRSAQMDLISLVADPSAWLALLTLVVLEVVLGIDNLVFIAILSNKLPKSQQSRARRIGLVLALVMRIALLLLIGWLVTLTKPVFDLGLQGAPDAHGELSFETAFSGRDLILLAGGLFLLWKATKEIHHNMDPEESSGELLDRDMGVVQIGFTAAIAQIIALDLVFSVDSILTAVGMTDQVPIMVTAVVITVGIMLFAADPLARFIDKNPTLVMLALAFLVMIGLVLIADGFGFHVPKGYIYVAMMFSVAVELLNMASRNRRKRANERSATP